MRPFRLIAAAAALAVSTPALACEDDPRLAQLARLIAATEAGESDPVPVTVTSFIILPERVRAPLSDRLLVLGPDCAPHQTVAGELPLRLTVPVYELLHAVEHFAMNGDTEQLSFIQRNVRAEAMTSPEILSLGVRTPHDPFFSETMSPALGVPRHMVTGSMGWGGPVPARDWNGVGHHEEPHRNLSLLDIYWRFGGRPSDAAGRVVVGAMDARYGPYGFWHVPSDVLLHPEASGRISLLSGPLTRTTLALMGFETIGWEKRAGNAEARAAYRDAYLATWPGGDAR